MKSKLGALLCFGIALALPVKSVAQERIFESTWALSNSITISDCFASLYLQHGVALQHGAESMRNGDPASTIAGDLAQLPGIDGILVVNGVNGERIITPNGVAPIDSLTGALLAEDGLFKQYVAPMTHKLLGGRCKFRQISIGSKRYDLMVMPIANDPNQVKRRSVIALLLDRSWLLNQVPSKMDSLSRESSQLLFWASSPRNTQWAQSIGIVAGSDTLWWSGPKVDIKDQQALWPLSDVKIFSIIRKLN